MFYPVMGLLQVDPLIPLFLLADYYWCSYPIAAAMP